MTSHSEEMNELYRELQKAEVDCAIDTDDTILVFIHKADKRGLKTAQKISHEYERSLEMYIPFDEPGKADEYLIS